MQSSITYQARNLVLVALFCGIAGYFSCSKSYANTIVVTSLLDPTDPNGNLTLRQAIGIASPGDTISFHPSLNGQSIFLNVNSGTLLIHKSLAFTATNLPGGVTIDGNAQGGGHFTIMRITQGPVSLNNITITHAGGISFSSGGAIFAQGNVNLTLTNCRILSNVAKGLAGGIQCGNLVLQDTTIAGNFGDTTPGGIFAGGPSVNISNCSIHSNQSQTGTGGIELSGQTAQANVAKTTIVNNSGSTGGITFGGNGAILAVSECTFANNVSISSGGAFHIGGSNQNQGPSATFEGCTFTANRAYHGDVLRASGCRVTLHKCSATDNIGPGSAFSTDFASLTLSDCDIKRNGPYGFAVIAYSSSLGAQLLVERSDISDNLGPALKNISGGPTAQPTILRCSRIENNRGTGIINDNGTVEIYNCKILDNVSTSTSPAAGGIYHNTGEMTIEQTTIDGNSGTTVGGIICQVNPVIGKSTLVMNYCTVSNNHTTSSNGSGGGIAGINGAEGISVSLNTCTISGNSCADGRGGGVYFDSGPTYSSLALKSCTISQNSCTGGSGGGVYIKSLPTAKVEVNNTIVAGNDNTIVPDVDGSVQSKGYNLIGEMDGSAGWVGTDLTGTIEEPLDPVISPLGYHGGLTLTHALRNGSPAIDAGDPDLAGTEDQCGVTRDKAPDIGSYEFSGAGPGSGIWQGHVTKYRYRN